MLWHLSRVTYEPALKTCRSAHTKDSTHTLKHKLPTNMAKNTEHENQTRALWWLFYTLLSLSLFVTALNVCLVSLSCFNFPPDDFVPICLDNTYFSWCHLLWGALVSFPAKHSHSWDDVLPIKYLPLFPTYIADQRTLFQTDQVFILPIIRFLKVLLE